MFLLQSSGFIRCSLRSVLWKEVEEGWVGYDERNGMTFFVDPLSRFVFDLLRQQTENIKLQSLSLLVRRAVPELQDNHVESSLGRVLDVLKSARLIEIIGAEYQ